MFFVSARRLTGGRKRGTRMKITFLGTSWGVPTKERYCSSTMIEAGGSVYIIDAGAPLIDILTRRGVEISRVKGIFTTHFHDDHIDGLPSFIRLCFEYYGEGDTDVYLTEQAGIDAMKLLLKTALGWLPEKRVTFRLMTEKTVYEDENIRITPFPTKHLAGSGRPSYAYLIEADGKKALFSGDLSARLEKEDFPAYALEHDVDLMVLEMAHFDAEDAEAYLKRCRVKQLLFNHVYPEEKFEKIRAMDGKYGYPVRAAEDGDEIEL